MSCGSEAGFSMKGTLLFIVCSTVCLARWLRELLAALTGRAAESVADSDQNG